MRILVLTLLLSNVGYAVIHDGFPQEAYAADNQYEELEHDNGKEQEKTRISSDFAELSGIEVMEASPMKVTCLLYTSPSPRDRTRSRMPSSA